MLNDLLMGFCGFVGAQLLSADYIYKHRQYVLERIYYEKSRGIKSRKELLTRTGDIHDEYPLKDFVK